MLGAQEKAALCRLLSVLDRCLILEARAFEWHHSKGLRVEPLGVELPHVGHELVKNLMNVGIGRVVGQVHRNLGMDLLGSLLVLRA